MSSLISKFPLGLEVHHNGDGEIIGAPDKKCTFCFLIINYNGMGELSADSRCLYWKFQDVTFFFLFEL